jgi:hypothetical protein
MTKPVQPDLFAPAKPPRDDRKVLVEVLKRAASKARTGTVNGMTPAQFRRRYPATLPRITVPR